MAERNVTTGAFNSSSNVRLNRINEPICPVQQDMLAMGVRYHDIVERLEIIKRGFAQRLFDLRSAKGVSAREMSLSLGQGPGYINNLENQHNLPSMAQFFAICEYLEVTPSVFFFFGLPEGEDIEKLYVAAQTLDSQDLELVLALARRLQGEDIPDERH